MPVAQLHAGPRHFGAEPSSPELPIERIAQFHLHAAVEGQPPQQCPADRVVACRLPHDPQAESVFLPVLEVVSQVGRRLRLIPDAAQESHHLRILVHPEDLREVLTVSRVARRRSVENVRGQGTEWPLGLSRPGSPRRVPQTTGGRVYSKS